jgi:hypothetical protein
LAVIRVWNPDGLAVGIEENLVCVEAESSLGGRRSVHAESVGLPNSGARDERVPIVVGAVMLGIERNDPGGRLGRDVIE